MASGIEDTKEASTEKMKSNFNYNDVLAKRITSLSIAGKTDVVEDEQNLGFTYHEDDFIL